MSSTFTIATSIDEAIAAKVAGATVVAGGSDLVVGHRQGKTPLPNNLVAIDRIEDLGRIETTDDGGLRIGAIVTHARLIEDSTIVSHYSALADGAALVGSPSTRNVGTLGGNIMNSSPAMDTGGPLVVLAAELELQSPTGIRTVTTDQLWTGPGETSAADDELLVAVRLPGPAANSGSAYVRLEYRRAMEIAVVGAAAFVTLNANGTMGDMRIALTAVAPTIVAVAGISEMTGRAIDSTLLDDIAELARTTATPISDLRASDRYRRHTVGVMAKRAVAAAVTRAQGTPVAVPVNRSVGIGAAPTSNNANSGGPKS